METPISFGILRFQPICGEGSAAPSLRVPLEDDLPLQKIGAGSFNYQIKPYSIPHACVVYIYVYVYIYIRKNRPHLIMYMYLYIYILYKWLYIVKIIYIYIIYLSMIENQTLWKPVRLRFHHEPGVIWINGDFHRFSGYYSGTWNRALQPIAKPPVVDQPLSPINLFTGLKALRTQRPSMSWMHEGSKSSILTLRKETCPFWCGE